MPEAIVNALTIAHRRLGKRLLLLSVGVIRILSVLHLLIVTVAIVTIVIIVVVVDFTASIQWLLVLFLIVECVLTLQVLSAQLPDCSVC